MTSERWRVTVTLLVGVCWFATTITEVTSAASVVLRDDDAIRRLIEVHVREILRTAGDHNEVTALKDEVRRLREELSSLKSSQETKNDHTTVRWLQGAVQELKEDLQAELKSLHEDSLARGLPDNHENVDALLMADATSARADLQALRTEHERSKARLEQLALEVQALTQHAQHCSATLAALSVKVESAESMSTAPSTSKLDLRVRRLEKRIKSALWQRAQLATLRRHVDQIERHQEELEMSSTTVHPNDATLAASEGPAEERLGNIELEIRRLVDSLPKECSEVTGPTGQYLLAPTPTAEDALASPMPLQAWCDQNTGAGGWTVVQRRSGSNAVRFDRLWSEYQQGFGSPAGDFWIGNAALRRLTADNCTSLRVDIRDIYGEAWFAEYAQFSVGPASDGYRLAVSGYAGNASDALSYQNGAEFSAQDRDRDMSATHCAENYEGGWWFSHCQHVNLNGKYSLGLTWFQQDKNEWIAVASSEIKIRRRAGCER